MTGSRSRGNNKRSPRKKQGRQNTGDSSQSTRSSPSKGSASSSPTKKKKPVYFKPKCRFRSDLDAKGWRITPDQRMLNVLLKDCEDSYEMIVKNLCEQYDFRYANDSPGSTGQQQQARSFTRDECGRKFLRVLTSTLVVSAGDPETYSDVLEKFISISRQNMLTEQLIKPPETDSGGHNARTMFMKILEEELLTSSPGPREYYNEFSLLFMMFAYLFWGDVDKHVLRKRRAEVAEALLQHDSRTGKLIMSGDHNGVRELLECASQSSYSDKFESLWNTADAIDGVFKFICCAKKLLRETRSQNSRPWDLVRKKASPTKGYGSPNQDAYIGSFSRSVDPK